MKARAAALVVVALVLLLALAVLLAPRAAEAQQAGKVARIAFLSSQSAASGQGSAEAFTQGLRELGYVEGRNIRIEYRWADGHYERLTGLAKELVELNVDVIVSVGGAPSARAAKAATKTIPVVFVTRDPVATGLVASVARPGGNLTGIDLISAELDAKRLEILKETLPTAREVAVLFSSQRARIVALAARSRLPAAYFWREFVEAGGLLSYAVNLQQMHRRMATFVDKILKGARPADLPVELPTKFELVVNLKTAKALGLTIPPSVLLRADQVIE